MTNLTSVQRPISALRIASKLIIPGSRLGGDGSGRGVDFEQEKNVSRVDPATDTLVENVAVGRAPCPGLAVGFGSVWVPSCGDNRLDRIDAASNQVVAHIQTSVGNSEGGIAAGEGGGWMVADEQGTLLHIDPQRNEIVARVQTAPGSFVPIVCGGSI
jgi:virginiamycin B lyase